MKRTTVSQDTQTQISGMQMQIRTTRQFSSIHKRKFSYKLLHTLHRPQIIIMFQDNYVTQSIKQITVTIGVGQS